MMTDEEKLESIDLTSDETSDEDALWAINFLLNMSTEDDLPLVLPLQK